MKKSKVTGLLCTVVVFTAVMFYIPGCGRDTAEVQKQNVEETLSVQEAEENMKITESEEIVVSNPDELPDNLKGLIILVDSLLLYYIEYSDDVKTDEPEVIWQLLHYAVGNYGAFYDRAELIEGEYVTDRAVVEEFLSAFMPEFEDIPNIPFSLKDRIRYEEEEKQYYFSAGDRGLSQTEILSYRYPNNDTVVIHARLYGVDDDATIQEGTFTFSRNGYAASVVEPLFYYSLTDAEF